MSNVNLLLKGNVKMVFERSLEKVQEREKERMREETKKRKKLENAFLNMLHEAEPEVTEESVWEKIRSDVENKPEFSVCPVFVPFFVLITCQSYL